MATSNSIDFKSTAQELIHDSAAIVKVIAPGETLSGSNYATCERILNRQLKAYQAKGLNLFTKTEVVIFQGSGSQSYDLSASGDHACNASELIETEIGADEASGQTVITVDSTTGMAASDYIGIEQDDDTIHWTTIVSVDDATTVTISSATTAASTTDNNVYTYTTRLNRPMDIVSARYKNDSGNETKLNKVAREQYFTQNVKSSNGQPNIFYYDPQLNAGKLYVWPVITNLNGYITATAIRTVEDIDSSADNFDFPAEWELAISLNLAVLIGRVLGRSEESIALEQMARDELVDAMMWDNEHTSLHLIPRRD